jgi:transposase
VRSREDAVVAQRRARQQLKALLLRHEICCVGRTSWTGAHRRWLSELKLPEPAQQIAFEEYVMAIEAAGERVARLTGAIEEHIGTWRFAPVVAGLQGLRGVQFIHAVTLICELGDLTRFDTPRHLMGYLGLVPREDSSGPARRQGSITKAGNSSARRALIEAAWAYRYRARLSVGIARRQSDLPKPVTDLA